MKRGREIGFPTCNINLKDYLIPKLGVYSVDVGLKGSKVSIKALRMLAIDQLLVLMI